MENNSTFQMSYSYLLVRTFVKKKKTRNFTGICTSVLYRIFDIMLHMRRTHNENTYIFHHVRII